ncbi:MAG: hypothetical protein JWO38_3193 [Gemmataceae bacterium]|nr:hypothetical protein [Gemmataceae bacterium]
MDGPIWSSRFAPPGRAGGENAERGVGRRFVRRPGAIVPNEPNLRRSFTIEADGFVPSPFCQTNPIHVGPPRCGAIAGSGRRLVRRNEPNPHNSFTIRRGPMYSCPVGYAERTQFASAPPVRVDRRAEPRVGFAERTQSGGVVSTRGAPLCGTNPIVVGRSCSPAVGRSVGARLWETNPIVVGRSCSLADRPPGTVREGHVPGCPALGLPNPAIPCHTAPGWPARGPILPNEPNFR